MKHRPYSMNFPDRAPDSRRGMPVPFAVVIMAGISALLIGAHINADALHIFGAVLTFSGIFALGEIRYKRCKSVFYCVAIAAVFTGIGVAILTNAFFDWLY